ncbi:MAG TPA: large conductance mechanosensitive channel protein MscL [Fimbriimonas sp.]|nr:large conductance mechanosensitive channel protein MscL [Fimbriimonas sp.]
MLKEFREFITKGNMVEIAIGLLIASGFTALVASLTKNLISPIIGVFGQQNFDNQFIILKVVSDPKKPKIPLNPTLAEAQAGGAVTLNYGAFISDIINFLILAFVVFLILKMYKKVVERFKKEEPPTAPAAPAADIVLLTEIRDLLKAKP